MTAVTDRDPSGLADLPGVHDLAGDDGRVTFSSTPRPGSGGGIRAAVRGGRAGRPAAAGRDPRLGVALVLLGMVYGSVIDSVTDLLTDNERAAELVVASAAAIWPTRSSPPSGATSRCWWPP